MINNFSKELDKIFRKYKKNERILDFKEEMLDSMLEKYNELIESGKSEEESYIESMKMLDGIKETLTTFEKENPIPIKIPKFTSLLSISIMFWLTVTLIYIGISFVTGNWAQTWKIYPIAVSIFITSTFVLIYKKAKGNNFSCIARFSMLGLILSSATIIYLLWSFIFHSWNLSWIIYLVGLLTWYSLDIILRVKLENKNNNKFKITLFDIVVIIILVTILTYILVSFLSKLWSITWIIFVAGFILIFLEIYLYSKDNK